MYDFAYHRPCSLKDALALLAESPEARPLAGGQTLLPVMKQRLAAPSALVDLSGVPELRGIDLSPQAVTIGALTTHAEIAESAEVTQAIPALSAMAAKIGDQQVRHRGTLGGSIANNDPAADYPAALLGLDAVVVTDRREIAAADFFIDILETALQPGELVVAVRFPIPRTAAYARMDQPASRFALVGVFVGVMQDGGVRVAVTGAGPCVFRQGEMETSLTHSFRPEALAGLDIAAEGLNSDLHGSPEYRAHLIGVLARRAVVACL
ncbi:xanthine dehydrogenase family protein subunit M [Telmatospirillum sp. J64-1]|uniref:FAD binding domain-containing protein n=1 Tax=Telmatospirillum sp. J64-1 TaxID=2502183 RepID=UPI00115CB56B|nr:xanthine dehydrogenase family protein subunit M [Telmatospirillum sp. J64-1]